MAFSSPEGPAGVVTEVSVVFDRPVHPVGVVVDAPAPFRVSPEVPGSFRWVGSRAAIFTPERRFPLATAFTVEVAAGLQALDGTRLAEPHRFAFETRRPALVQASPGPEQTGVEPRAELRLELDQVVTPAALSAACQLRIEQNGRSSAAAFDVLPDPQQARVLRARPKRPLPPHSAVSFVIGASLRGVEGPLTSNTSTTVRFFTYDPLAFESVSCARNRDTDPCEAESTVALTFNNGIKLRELATKLHVTPDVGVKLDKGDDGFTTWANLRGAFRAGQSYRVQIDAGLTDSFGQSLQQPASVVFRFADHYPRVDIGAVGRNFFGKSLSVPVASRNVPSFELLTAALTPQDVLSLREAERSGRDGAKDLDWLSHFKGTVRQQVRPGGAKNQIERLDVDALKVLGAGGRGALAIGARYGASSADDRKPAAMKVLSVSDLAITAKLSRFGSLVWVTDRADNAPVAGAQVELHVPGRPSRSYGTDAAGLARIPPEDFAPNLAGESDEARAILVARRGLDSAFAPVSELIEGYRLDVPTDFAGELRPYGVLFTDRGIYRPGDDVWLKGIVRRETPTGNALPGERAVTVTLRSPA
ncbi:MAG TPA: Ig-like domain-containing protein, partial [Polyangiaceae bacterium]|nr:Ig-like domain-containing protein [Polyangiaceae bacterium]